MAASSAFQHQTLLLVSDVKCSLIYLIGDLVLLRQGDSIPADIRLCACNSLQIDEMMLTGMASLFYIIAIE